MNFENIPVQTKRCSACKCTKPYSEFHKSKTSKTKLVSACKSCCSDRARRRRETPEIYARDRAVSNARRRAPKYRAQVNERYARDAGLRRRQKLKLLGLSVQEFAQILTRQNNLCAICFEPETAMQFGRIQDLAIDHDHKTLVVRELLCSNCNRAIGLLQDSPEIVLSAAMYLKKHKALAATVSNIVPFSKAA